ncbi:MAG: hypothetical protein ABJK11_10855 [Balneola sp.]
MKILLLGQLVISTKLIIALKKTELDFSILSTETKPISKQILANPFFDQTNYKGRFYNFFKLQQAKYTRFLFAFPFVANIIPSRFLNSLTSTLKTDNPDLIIGNWGVGILPEINLIKSLSGFKKKPMVLNMETFPTGWNSKIREYLELLFLKFSFKNIDGLIIPTNEMYDLLISHNIPLQKKKIYKSPFYFDMSHFGESKTKEVLPKYDLIFFGKPDLFRSLNSVQGQLRGLADAGITIGCSQLFEIEHANIHSFQPFDIYDSSIDFLKISERYKAALVTFNTDGNYHPVRFNTSLPHRFLLPLALKLPIAVPAKGFGAIGSLIEKFGIGFLYDSAKQLKEYLHSTKVDTSRSNIIQNKTDLDFNAESFKNYLAEF